MLDGGLATSLEALGCDLRDPLWSARVLLDAPELIRRAHLDFLRAGADCIATVSYQATVEGFRRRGLSDDRARALIRRSAELALDARDRFWQEERPRGRLRPLVAASVGPYGAFLADGSEYTGRYDRGVAGLLEFHRDRWQLLSNTPVDLMACETIPSGPEVEALLELLAADTDRWAWISLSCPDGTTLADGTPLERVARSCDAVARVAGIGVNCLAPRHVAGLVRALRSVTEKPILVYPNSGERWAAAEKAWKDAPEAVVWGRRTRDWLQAGATVVGGCCRVGPGVIGQIRAAVDAAETQTGGA